MARESRKPEWEIRIDFVPFTSDLQREHSYRDWVRLFIRAKENELKSRANKNKTKGDDPCKSFMSPEEGQVNSRP